MKQEKRSNGILLGCADFFLAKEETARSGRGINVLPKFCGDYK